MTSPGEQFGPYRVLSVIGRGGMGEVLRAHDDEHDRDVALKVLAPQWAADATYQERFRREARVVARLREPHVIPIHRYGEIEGRLFLDMRLVEGEDLASLVSRTGPLDPARAVDVVGQLARALDAAHADGLVHRDVKPSNVLLVARSDGGDLADNRPGEDFVYLVDFGIARTSDASTGPPLTGTGLALGSTEYMAPERFTGLSLDGRADVYSLACLLFELLTGRRPFRGVGAAEHMYAHLQEEPPAPSSVQPGLPDLLDAVVLRGLAKDRDQRWTSAGGMAAAARAALSVAGVDVPRPPDGLTAPTTVGPMAPGAAERPSTRVTPQSPPQATLAGGAPVPVPGGHLGPGPQQQGVPLAFGSQPGPQPLFPQQPFAPVPSGARPAAVPGRRSARVPVALAVVAALVAVTLGVLLLLADRRGDDAAAAAESAERRLLALGLPADVDPDDCSAADGEDEALTVLTCGVSASDSGPSGATYTLYSDSEAADDALLADIASRDVGEFPADTSTSGSSGCSSSAKGQGWKQMLDSSSDAVIGLVSCSVDGNGDTVLAWTWADLGVLGRATLRGGQENGISTLTSWWSSNVDRY